MTPTIEEYRKAKEVVRLYDEELNRLYAIDFEAFREDLKEYFKRNLIDGMFPLKNFELKNEDYRKGKIIPIEPSMEEYYDGGNNNDIDKICKKHDVNFIFPYWCYPK